MNAANTTDENDSKRLDGPKFLFGTASNLYALFAIYIYYDFALMGPIRFQIIIPSLLWLGNENVLRTIETSINFVLETKERRIEKTKLRNRLHTITFSSVFLFAQTPSSTLTIHPHSNLSRRQDLLFFQLIHISLSVHNDLPILRLIAANRLHAFFVHER